MVDLDASINLKPYKLFKKLGLGEPKPPRISVQLVDRSIKYPIDNVEDMLVNVDEFIFQVDFLICVLDEDIEVFNSRKYIFSYP